MQDDAQPRCPLCGDHHEDLGDIIGIASYQVPCVPGSRMRRGGQFVTESGLVVGTDEWRRTRCGYCGAEAMAPDELISPLCEQTRDGAYLGHCSSCDFDLRSGYQPGHNPNRRRRRRR